MKGLKTTEPAVSRVVLVRTAGLLWLAVGLMLVAVALSRLGGVTYNPWLLVAVGIIAGLLKSRFVLGVLASKNLERIRELSPHKEKICVFAFQANLSYLLVIFMMVLGMTLRRMNLPPDVIVPLYIMIGTALIHAALKYINAKI